MPELTDPLQPLLSDITEHVRTLNNVFRSVHELGLKVYVSTRSMCVEGPEYLTVHVWREEDLLRTAPEVKDHPQE